MHTALALYRRDRFRSEIISHTVWLPFRFALSYRDVDEMMAVRGIFLRKRFLMPRPLAAGMDEPAWQWVRCPLPR